MSWESSYYNATVIVYLPGKKPEGKKYHNVHIKKIGSFRDWAKKNIAGAHHINFYHKSGEKKFARRLYV
jgi:hypothetical protein